MSEKKFGVSNFETEVLDADKPVLVDFWATWCMPCRMLAPTIEELAEDLEGKVIVGKVNVDEDPDLARKYRVASIPTLIVFENGAEVRRSVGVVAREDILDMLGIAEE
ncbi:MAG: thioredoxin [Clostridia bacterium]|nr:thioredoxin [Clostridia bacterium]